jgi:pentatricopeptide repeat protein
VLNQMFTPTYTALMDGYCLQNQMDEARKVLDIMVGKGCAPASWSVGYWVRPGQPMMDGSGPSY